MIINVTMDGIIGYIQNDEGGCFLLRLYYNIACGEQLCS